MSPKTHTVNFRAHGSALPTNRQPFLLENHENTLGGTNKFHRHSNQNFRRNTIQIGPWCYHVPSVQKSINEVSCDTRKHLYQINVKRVILIFLCWPSVWQKDTSCSSCYGNIWCQRRHAREQIIGWQKDDPKSHEQSLSWSFPRQGTSHSPIVLPKTCPELYCVVF